MKRYRTRRTRRVRKTSRSTRRTRQLGGRRKSKGRKSKGRKSKGRKSKGRKSNANKSKKPTKRKSYSKPVKYASKGEAVKKHANIVKKNNRLVRDIINKIKEFAKLGKSGKSAPVEIIAKYNSINLKNPSREVLQHLQIFKNRKVSGLKSGLGKKRGGAAATPGIDRQKAVVTIALYMMKAASAGYGLAAFNNWWSATPGLTGVMYYASSWWGITVLYFVTEELASAAKDAMLPLKVAVSAEVRDVKNRIRRGSRGVVRAAGERLVRAAGPERGQHDIADYMRSSRGRSRSPGPVRQAAPQAPRSAGPVQNALSMMMGQRKQSSDSGSSSGSSSDSE
jgi:hypothetical protein